MINTVARFTLKIRRLSSSQTRQNSGIRIEHTGNAAAAAEVAAEEGEQKFNYRKKR